MSDHDAPRIDEDLWKETDPAIRNQRLKYVAWARKDSRVPLLSRADPEEPRRRGSGGEGVNTAGRDGARHGVHCRPLERDRSPTRWRRGYPLVLELQARLHARKRSIEREIERMYAAEEVLERVRLVLRLEKLRNGAGTHPSPKASKGPTHSITDVGGG